MLYTVNSSLFHLYRFGTFAKKVRKHIGLCVCQKLFSIELFLCVYLLHHFFLFVQVAIVYVMTLYLRIVYLITHGSSKCTKYLMCVQICAVYGFGVFE